jgi:crossover junction endodeoxyribonuclease RusA
LNVRTILLTLPYPVSANRYWASRVVSVKGRPMPMTYVTADAKAYKADVQKLCVAAGIRAPIVGRVAIAVQLFPHRPLDFKTRMRKHGEAWDDTVQSIDLDNANKVLLDALKGIAIEDDRWVRRLSSERMEPDGEARVVVTITALAQQRAQADLLEAAA